MGFASGQICKVCGTSFRVQDGGGFFFDMLHCDTCGEAKSVGHVDLGDIHFGFVKGLGRPVRRRPHRRWTGGSRTSSAGEPLSRDEYHAAAEATLAPCSCGGRFRYDAPARCPNCRSTREQWERDPAMARHVR